MESNQISWNAASLLASVEQSSTSHEFVAEITSAKNGPYNVRACAAGITSVNAQSVEIELRETEASMHEMYFSPCGSYGHAADMLLHTRADRMLTLQLKGTNHVGVQYCTLVVAHMDRLPTITILLAPSRECGRYC